MTGLAARANEDRPLLGIALMLMAFLFFSYVDVSAKLLAMAGLVPIQLAFVRYAGAFCISTSMIARGGITIARFSTDRIGLVILRGALLTVSSVMNFIAVRHLPLTLTSTILFSAPIFVCILSGPMLGERVGIWRWSAILVGFSGVIVAIQPFGESYHWAVLLSLCAAICFSLYVTITRMLAGQVAAETMQFYTGLVGTSVLLPFAVWQWQNPEAWQDWLLLLGMGFFGWLGHEILTRAHGMATASTLTPFGYMFIVYLTLWSYLLFDHVPGNSTVTGAIIIVAAGLVIWFRERIRAARSAAPSGL